MPLAISPDKMYVNKAVQTVFDDLPPKSHLDAQNKSITAQEPSYSTGQSIPVLHRATGLDDLSRRLDTAYSHPLPSDSCPISPQLGPSRSPLTTRRIYKHPQILYRRPPQFNDTNKRVISFPETTPEIPFNTNSIVSNGLPTRVVSLSELVQYPLLEPAVEQNSCLEYFGTSADTSYRSSKDESIYHRIHNFPPSSVPTTPSPPSSPDSILIINNDSHVPRSFLRKTSRSRSSTFSEDDAGTFQHTNNLVFNPN